MDGGDEVAHADGDAVDSQRSSLLGILFFLAVIVGIWLLVQAVEVVLAFL